MRKIYVSFFNLFAPTSNKIFFLPAEIFRQTAVIFFTIFFLFGINNSASAQPGPAWGYSRQVDLSTPTPLADFQVKVSLTFAKQAGMKTDGSDLRFYDNNNLKCNYWIEKWNDWDPSGTSIIWVKVPSNGATSVIMYYGNPAATAESDGDNTFDFFDDFLGTTLKSNWSTNTADGSITVSNAGTGEVNIHNNSVNIVAMSSPITTASPSFVLETKHKETAYWRNRFYATNSVILSAKENHPTVKDYFYRGNTRPDATAYCAPGPTTAIVSAGTDYLTAWKITDGSYYTWSTYDYKSNSEIYTYKPPENISVLIRNIVISVTEATSSTIVDWVRVRKSVPLPAKEPTTSVDDEQILFAPSVAGFTPPKACEGSNTIITINGDNFDHVTAVQINGIDVASFTIVSRTKITAVQPLGVTSGKISVTSPRGTSESSADFTINPLPAIFNVTVSNGGKYCAGTTGPTITMSKTESGISYQLFKNAVAVGDPVTGTGSALTFTNQTEEGSYSIIATNSSTGCTQTMNGSPAIVMNSVAAFNVTGGGRYCAGGTGVAVGLDGSVAGVNYQLLLNDNPVGTAKAGTGAPISFLNLTAEGNYTVAGTNVTTGCTATMTGSKSITIDPLPTGTLIGTEASGNTNDNKICIGASVTFTATAGYANYDFKINNVSIQSSGANTFNTNTLTIGNKTITVEVTNADGCTVTFDPVIVTVNPLPTGTLKADNYSVCPGTKVTFTAAVTNGSNYKFYINTTLKYDGALNTFSTATLKEGDNVTVEVINNNGCGVTLTAPAVKVKPLPAVAGTIIGISPVCQGQNGVTYTVGTITNATSYTWTLPSGVTISSGSGTHSIKVNFSKDALSGNITVAGTNGCGDGTSSAIAVQVNPLPVDAGTITGSTSVCQAQTGVKYSVPAITNATGYTWALPKNATITSGANTNTIFVDYSGTAVTGEVSVYGTNDCGNGVASTLAVTVNPLPLAAGTITGSAAVCQGSPGVAYHIPAITNATSYTWSYTGAEATVSGTTKDITIDFSSTATSGTLTVVGKNDCGEGIVSKDYSITVNPLPTAIIGHDGNIAECLNSTIKPGITFTGSGGTAPYTFTYNIEGGANQTITTTSGSSITLYTPTTVAGTFTYNLVSVKDKSSTACTNAQAGSAAVTINALPVPVLTGPDHICPDETLSYSTEFGNGIHDYIWTITGGDITTDGGGAATDHTVEVHWHNDALPKSIYVNYTDNNGCAGATSVSVASNPVTSPVISGDKIVCLNSTGIVYTAQDKQTNYNWTITGGEITSGGTETDNTATVTWNTSGPQSISVNFTNSGGCSAPASTVYPVTVNPLPTATLSVDNAAVCQNSTSPVITFTGDNSIAPYTFIYNINGGANQTVKTTSGNSKTITVPTSTSGIYKYQLISVSGGNSCSQSSTEVEPVTVTVNTLPIAAISGNTAVCQNSGSPDITFTGSNGTAPYTFTYKINNGTNLTVTTTSGDFITVPASTGTAGPFIYSLISVKDANGCEQPATGSATVTVNPLPTTTISAPSSVCLNDGTVVITFTGAGGTAPYTFTYKIGSGANQTVTSAGNVATVPVISSAEGTFAYTLVSVKDASSTACEQNQTGSATVIVTPVSEGGAANGSAAVCTGSNNGTLTVSGQTGKVIRWESSTDGTTWASINNTTTSLTFSNLTATTQYRAVVQSGNCAIAYSEPATITVNTANGGTVSGNATVCAGSNGQVTLAGNTGNVIRWETSTDNGVNWVLDNTRTSTIFKYTGISQTTLFRAVSQSSPCAIATSATAKVIVNQRPTGVISTAAPSICINGSTTLTLTLTGTGAINGTLSDGTVFTGTSASPVTLTVSPSATTLYTIATLTDANCSSIAADLTGNGSITVYELPEPVVINPGNTTICKGGILPLTSVLSTVGNYTFVTPLPHVVNKVIPDNDPTGIKDAINVKGIPVGAIVDSLTVNYTIHHKYMSDLAINLTSPNGKTITLASTLDPTENSINTTISSNKNYDVISSATSPYTGTYAAEGNGEYGAQDPFVANTRLFVDLFGTPALPANGNWVFSTHDRGFSDEGTLDNWSLTIFYHVPENPVPIVWAPKAGLYRDPSATVPYDGEVLGTVYAKPEVTTVYTGTSTNLQTCSSSSQMTITVNPAPVVTVKADYCAVTGFVQLTATSVPAATSYTWNTGATGATVLVDEAQLYIVSASTGLGCFGTGMISVAQELVKNGDFEAPFTPGDFKTEYVFAPGPGNTQDPSSLNWSLGPEGRYAIDTSAHNYNRNFYGKDHTTSAQKGKFLIVNGFDNADKKVLWEQTVTVLPNTNYYYSAWAMRLSQGNPAQLQFSVNGVPIGTIADLTTVAQPTTESEVTINNWTRFYYGNTNGWNSGSNTTAIIRIIDLNPKPAGNDFGLDDISFATLSTFITKTSEQESDHQTVCKSNPIINITYTVGSGGSGPIVTGLPAGVTSEFNGITLTISGAPTAVAGTYTYTVTTQGSCRPTTATGTITVRAQSVKLTSAAGTSEQGICINTSIRPVQYTISGLATAAGVTGLPAGVTGTFNQATGVVTITGAPSEAGTFTYKVKTSGDCNFDSLSGTITVNIQTIEKTSGEDNQALCINTAITDIVYAVTGTGTGAVVVGLPNGVKGVFAGGIFTLSGTPIEAGKFDYTITTKGSCAAAAATGTIAVTPDAAITLNSPSGTEAQIVCVNSGIINIIYRISGGGTGASITGLPDGVTGNFINGTYTISGAPAAAGDFTYTITTTGTCGQTSTTGSISVNPQPVGGSLSFSYNSGSCYPSTGTLTLNGHTGNIKSWEKSVDEGKSWMPVANTTTTLNFSIPEETYYRAIIDGGACDDVYSSAISVGVHNLWTGRVSSDWNDVDNWSDGEIPSPSCPDVTIPEVITNYPVISTGVTATVNNIIINLGASLTVNGGKLQLAGKITNQGTFDASKGTLEFNGSSAQTTETSIAVNNLVINNVAGVTINAPLDIYRSLNFSTNGKTLHTGSQVTLKSTVSETAWVGDLTGKTIDGKVTVERYINIGTGAGQHAKAWELLAVPTKGQSVYNSWMEGGSKASTGYGTQVTGHGTGFDMDSPSASVKYYDATKSAEWVGITNTADEIFKPSGYMVFIRGDRSVDGKSNKNTLPTTLRTSGQLLTGPQSIPVPANSFASIGNPYASAIDMKKVMADKSWSGDNFFTVWNSNMGGNYGYGIYQTYLLIGSNYVSVPGNTANNFIQSGQAFFVQSTGTGGTMKFTEASKASGSANVFFRPQAPAVSLPQLQTNLYTVNTDGSTTVADGTFQQFSDGYTNGLDAMDARKFLNSSENLSVRSGGKDLIVERRHTIQKEDTIFYNLTSVKVQNYRMEFIARSLSSEGLEGFIEDTYLHNLTPLNLEGTTDLNFAATNVAASRAANRFRIIFRTVAVLPVTLVSAKAYPKNADIAVEWKVQNENNMKGYEIEKSIDGSNFATLAGITANNSGTGSYNWLDQHAAPGVNYYRIRSIDINGKAGYTETIKVMMGSPASGIAIFPNRITNGIINLKFTNEPAGKYGIRLLNPLGQLIVSKQIERAGGSDSQTITWDYNLAHGVYQLEVTKPDGNLKVIRVMY